MSENVVVGSFYNYLISNGYYFDKQLVENYLLSMKVKPFEILTGNSGTGKTKLSQLFAKYVFKSINDVDLEGKYVKVKGRVNFASWNSMGWTLDKKYFIDFLPIRQSESKFNLFVDDIPAEGSINISVQLDYTNEKLKDHLFNKWDDLPKEQKKKYSKGPEIDILIKAEDINNILGDYQKLNDYVNITKDSTASAYNDRQWNIGKDIFHFFPFKWGKVDLNIIVDGIESKAKLRALFKLSYSPNNKLQTYLEEKEGEEVNLKLNLEDMDFDSFVPHYDFCNSSGEPISSNLNSNKCYEIIPVGANWTDNTNIVGYYNVITENYQSTPAYELIKQAQKDAENPYFLILDEMNLSHVERYFADFLSAIESGEEIPLYGDDKTLKLPDNLFIIGTVNIDETTYMFSPKVLDRANTIEFDTLSVNEYMSLNRDHGDFEGDINYLQSPLRDSNISNWGIDKLKEELSQITVEDKNLWDILAIELTAFQETLKGSGFDFGFRVINEILRFMVVAWRYENSPNEWNNWERYFDAQIKQKILPKLHGSEKAIGTVLTNLFNLCLNERNNNENPKNTIINKEDCRYYTSALKLKDMAKVLSDQRYVSFIN